MIITNRQFNKNYLSRSLLSKSQLNNLEVDPGPLDSMSFKRPHPESYPISSPNIAKYRRPGKDDVKGSVHVFFGKLHHRGERGRKGRECKISKQSTENL